MKARKIACVIVVALLAFSCRDEADITASIVGKWEGTLAEVQVKPFGLPIPISRSDDTFSTQIEFTTDGKIILTDGQKVTEGTYQLNGDQLTTDVDFDTGIIELAGTYTIETLTNSQLVFYLKKHDTFTDPETGRSISGDLKATLHFNRR